MRLLDRYIGIILFKSKLYRDVLDALKEGRTDEYDHLIKHAPNVLKKRWPEIVKPMIEEYNAYVRSRDRIEVHAFEARPEDENLTLLVIVADHHPEPILKIISQVEHKFTIKEWSVGAFVDSGLVSFPQIKAIDFLRLGEVVPWKSTGMSALKFFTERNFFVARLIGRWTLAIFYKKKEWAQEHDPGTYDDNWSYQYNDLYEYDIALVKHIESLLPQQDRREHSSAQYDPFAAQLNEVKNSFGTYIVNRIQDLISRSKVVGKPPSPPQLKLDKPLPENLLRNLLKERDRMLIELSKRIKKTREGGELTKEKVFEFTKSIDLISSEYESLNRYLDRIEDLITGREEKELSSGIKHLRFQMLAATQKVVDDLWNRCISGKVKKVIVNPGTNLSIYRPGEALLSAPNEKDVNAFRIACFPDRLMMRLGAFPLLAHLIGHVIAELHLTNKEIREIGKWATNKFQMTDGGYQMEYNTGIEILAHSTAAAITGPAYLLAFARFLTGYLTWFLDVRTFDYRLNMNISPAAVVSICLGIIERTIGKVVIRSWMIDKLESESESMLFELATKGVRRIYDSRDHHKRMPEVQAALMSGKILENTESILVLNALWDAVIGRKGYLNEISALLSVA